MVRTGSQDRVGPPPNGLPMIRVICPHCSVVFLILASPDDGEQVVCPHCHRSFAPEEEEWVDPEDE
jgi:uncharacterized Zn-finger protein